MVKSFVKLWHDRITPSVVAFVLVLSSVAASVPLFLSSNASAIPLASYQLKSSASSLTVEAGTGVASFTAFAEYKFPWSGWNDAWSETGSSSITATVSGAELSLNGSSWSTSQTRTIPLLAKAESTFSVRTATVGSYTINLSAKLATTEGVRDLTTNVQLTAVDTTPPNLPTLEFPTNGSLINYNDFWFEWSDATGADKYEFRASQSPATDPSTGALNNNVWQGDFQGIQPIASKARSTGASGLWYWQVRAVDTSGNASAWTAPWALTIDTDAPAAPILTLKTNGGTSLTNDGYTNQVGIVASWNKPSADTHHYIYKYWNNIPGNQWKQNNPWTLNNLTALSQSGSFTEGDGTHYMQVFAVDTAGNLSAGSNVFAINYDSTDPTFAINTPANGSSVAGTQTISAQVTDASGVKKLLMTLPTKSGNKTFVYEEGKSNNSLVKNGDIYSVTVDTKLLFDDGLVHAVLRGTDGAGNTRYWNNNAAHRQHSFTVDNLAPEVLTLVSDLTSFTNSAEGTFSWTADSDAVKFEYKLGTSTGETNGKNITLPISKYGSNVFSVRAFDAAGNAGEWKDLSFVFDNKAPVATVSEPTSVNAGNTATLTGTVSDDYSTTKTIRVYINGDLVGSTQTNGTTWSYFLPAQTAADNYDITVVAVDELGNTSLATDAVVWAVTSRPVEPNLPATQLIIPGGATANLGPQVLATEGITSPSAVAAAETEAVDGEVAEDEKEIIDKASSAFQWWWLIVVVAAGIFFVIAWRRRKADEK